jgi:CBS domain-containing protein
MVLLYLLGQEGDGMNISQCMKRHPVSIKDTASIREAAQIFVENHVGLLPVIRVDDRLTGVVGLRDLLSLQLPDFVNFVADVDFVHDFGAVETSLPTKSMLDGSIETLVKPAITVNEDTGLLRTYALMLQQDLHDMPVVSGDGKLVGVASRVDIGTTILSAWIKAETS